MIDLNLILQKQKIISLTRKFFSQNNFREFTLPLLLPALPLEQNIYSFPISAGQSQDKYFLTTSPESALKRLLARGSGDCFAISPSFRDLEAKSPHHQPEFLMLEWYQTNSDYLKIMDFCQIYILYLHDRLNKNKSNRNKYLLTYQNQPFDLTPPWPRLSFYQLLKKYHPQKSYPQNEPDLNQLFLNFVLPNLPAVRPIFITDYPAFMSPLAKLNLDGEEVPFYAAASGNPPIGGATRERVKSGTTSRIKIKKNTGYYNTAQRFELFFGNMEIANGNTENTKSNDVTRAFRTEDSYRRRHKLPSHPIDWDFVGILSRLPPSAGCGLGLERLTMLLTDTADISRLQI